MKKSVLHSLLFLLAGCIAAAFPTSPASAQQQNKAIKDREIIQAQSAYIDGLAAFENENYSKALDLLKTAYAKLPDQPGINYSLADTYLQINDLTNAEYYGRKASKLDPQNKWYHLKLAEIYRQDGRGDDTIGELKEALKYHSNDTNIIYELAQTYTENDSLLKANELYRRLLRLEGSSISIHLRRLENFADLKMQDSAIVELQEIRKLDPDNLSTLRVLSNYYLKMNRLQEAKKVLHNAIRINPKDSQTLTMLSDVYIKEAKWDSLQIMLGDIVSDSAISQHTKMNIGQYLYSKYNQNPKKDGLRKAVGYVLEKLMRAEAELGQAQSLAADFFTQTDQNDLALQALKKTNELVPTNDSAWHQRLQLLLVEGKVKEAIAVGQQAAREIPQDPIILYFLGSAYLSNHENQKAIDNFKEALTLPARKPLKASIHSGLGSALAALKKWDQAFTHYDKALTYNADNPGVLNNYAYYLSLQKRELPKAEKMARHALDLDPGNASYMDTMGWVYYQMGDFKRAQKFIQQALDTGKASAEVMEHMGDIMNKLQNIEKAKYWWRKALQKDSTRTYLKDKISK